MSGTRPIRVLIAKPGLDGHDRGAKVVALALRDAGFEVIYTGLHQSVEQIVETAVQEDVDVIGLSMLSGAHLSIGRTLLAQLQEAALDTPVVVGGNIPQRDHDALRALGVAAVLPTSTPLDEIARVVREIASKADHQDTNDPKTSS